MTDLVMLI